MKGYILCKAGFEDAARDEAFALFASFLQTARPHIGSGWVSIDVHRDREDGFCAQAMRALQRRLRGCLASSEHGQESVDHPGTDGPLFIWDILVGEILSFRTDERDRLSPVVDAIKRGVDPKLVRTSRVIVPDGDLVPGLRRFGSMFGKLLERKLPQPVPAPSAIRVAQEALVAFFSYELAVVMVRDRAASSHLMKRGRMQRRSRQASRSASKLAEAWRFFGIPEPQRASRAVDLGAAPGGWTGVLLEHAYDVVAVDNGPLQESLLSSPQVTHLKQDAFTYRPSARVDIMVCDVVDQPQKTSQLVQKWVERDWARRFVFNLKLPMKKHYAALNETLKGLNACLHDHWAEYRLDAHQLYHDRQEITVYVELIRRKPGRQK